MENFVATRIYELRKEKGISQMELTKSIGVTQKTVDFWEKGVNEPKANYIIRLSVFFKVSSDYLLGLEN